MESSESSTNVERGSITPNDPDFMEIRRRVKTQAESLSDALTVHGKGISSRSISIMAAAYLDLSCSLFVRMVDLDIITIENMESGLTGTVKNAINSAKDQGDGKRNRDEEH